METVERCPFCFSARISIASEQTHKDKYLDLVDPGLNNSPRYWMICGDCGFYFHSPRIDTEEEKILYSRYRDREFKGFSGDEYFEKLTAIPLDESEAYRRASFIRDVIPAHTVEKIIDIGCGVGIVLFYVKKLFPGATLTGIEPNGEYVDVVRRRLGIEVMEDYYRESLFEERFDLILCIDVLEHMRNFSDFWRTISGNITNRGFLFIETPSVENFQALPAHHDVFEAPHLYFFGEGHMRKLSTIHRFSLKSQKKTVNRAVMKDLYIFQYGEG